jgi:hypothetical protein
LLRPCLRDVQLASRRFDVRHLLGHLLAIISRTKNARFDRAHGATGPGGGGTTTRQPPKSRCRGAWCRRWKHFPGAAIVRLAQNYRSTGRILDCASAVIARSAERRPKRLWTDAGHGDPVRVVHLPGEEEEARFGAGEIGRDWPMAARRPILPFCIG